MKYISFPYFDRLLLVCNSGKTYRHHNSQSIWWKNSPFRWSFIWESTLSVALIVLFWSFVSLWTKPINWEMSINDTKQTNTKWWTILNEKTVFFCFGTWLELSFCPVDIFRWITWLSRLLVYCSYCVCRRKIAIFQK